MGHTNLSTWTCATTHTRTHIIVSSTRSTAGSTRRLHSTDLGSPGSGNCACSAFVCGARNDVENTRRWRSPVESVVPNSSPKGWPDGTFTCSTMNGCFSPTARWFRSTENE